MTVKRSGADTLVFEVPYKLGFTMIWDSFKCELKSARVCGVGRIRRERVQNARQAALQSAARVLQPSLLDFVR